MDGAYKHCEALIRERDRERFLSTLFARADKRPHLFALYAFDLEIAHIPDAVREPMAGEIRLQWWREAIAGERAEEVLANPVAAALTGAIKQHGLPREVLTEIIDARAFDLLGEPMPSGEALGKYLDATFGQVTHLASRILDSAADANAAAVLAAGAIGLTRVLRNLPHDVSRGRLFVPLDLLAAHEVHTASVLGGESSDGLRRAVAELCEKVRAKLTALRALKIPQNVLPAYLPAALIPLYLSRVEKAADLFRSQVEISPLRTQFALWLAARRGRV